MEAIVAILSAEANASCLFPRLQPSNRDKSHSKDGLHRPAPNTEKALGVQVGPLEALALGPSLSLLILGRKLEGTSMYILGVLHLKKVRIEQMDHKA
jgi:hypothetical protein